MSLVNDMLTDLDSRDENELEEIVLIDRQANKKIAFEEKRPALYLFLAFVVGAAGIWIGVSLQNGQDSTANDIYDLAVFEASPTNKNILLETGSIDRPLINVPDIHVAKSPRQQKLPHEILVVDSGSRQFSLEKNNALGGIHSSTVEVKTTNKISLNADRESTLAIDSTQGILLKARQALAANKLTTPSAGSAFSLYQKILYSNPKNSEARLGIREIAERYIAMADNLYLRGEWDRAKYYDNKASYVAGFYPELEAWLLGINRPRTRQESFSVVNENKNIGLDDVAKIKSVEHLNQKENSLVESDAPVIQNNIQSNVREVSSLSGSESSIRVERNRQTVKEQRIRKIKSLLAQSQIELAETELLSAELDFPKSNEIKRLLFDVYVNSNRQTLARKLIDRMADLAAYELAFLQSRILVSESNSLEAIELLEKFNPNVYAESDYYRLLAALYQSQGRHTESADQYKKLISVDGKQATYWLGLAVSLDALSDERGALQAFQWVRQYGIADREARAYVDQRIRSLSS